MTSVSLHMCVDGPMRAIIRDNSFCQKHCILTPFCMQMSTVSHRYAQYLDGMHISYSAARKRITDVGQKPTELSV